MPTDLPAGRELDALVAEKVMGVVWDERRCRICGWPLAENEAKGCVADNCSMRPMPERRADAHASYSTDIAAAWTVVEKLATMGRFFDLRWDGSGVWSCTAYSGTRDMRINEIADTAPLAICRAALKAVGHG